MKGEVKVDGDGVMSGVDASGSFSSKNICIVCTTMEIGWIAEDSMSAFDC